MVTVNEQGLAFEKWTFDVLRPYLMKLGVTKCNGNPDLYFDDGGHSVLLECKCFSHRTTQGLNSKPAYLSLRKSQVNALRNMKTGLDGENEIYLVVGILFSQYDMYPIVIELEQAISRAKRWKHGDGRRFISFDVLMKQKPFRLWMSERFNVEPEHIQFPEFRSYLR